MKVARGRSWQPEIGMEHASRGRRSGNKGVGARWRGRFRIFSARHCSRTKVSHAENSGMTMLFFSLEVAPVSEGDCFTRSGAASQPQPPVERQHEGLGGLGDLIRCAGRAQERPFGAVTPLERRDEYYALFVFVGGAVAVCFEGCCGSMCWPVDRPGNRSRRWSGCTRGFDFFWFGEFFHTLGSDGTRNLIWSGNLFLSSDTPHFHSHPVNPPHSRPLRFFPIPPSSRRQTVSGGFCGQTHRQTFPPAAQPALRGTTPAPTKT